MKKELLPLALQGMKQGLLSIGLTLEVIPTSESQSLDTWP